MNMNRIKKNIILLLVVFTTSCIKRDISGFHYSDYLIISASNDLLDSKVTLRSFDSDGNIVDKAKIDAAYAWNTQLTDNNIAIVGTDHAYVIDYKNNEVFEMYAESEIDNISIKDKRVAFTINNGYSKETNEYVSNVCTFNKSNSKEYTAKDYTCTQSEYAPSGILINDDEILVLMMGFYDENEYLIKYKFDLEINKYQTLSTQGNHFLSYKSQKVLSDHEGYYLLDDKQFIPVDNEADRFTYIHCTKDSFLRTNYNEDGNKIYVETIKDNNEIESKMILDSKKGEGRISVESDSNTNIVSILNNSTNQSTIRFYDLDKKKYIDNFEYQIDKSENVIGAYYLK